MNLLAFLLAHFIRRGAQGLTVVNLLPGACRAFMSLREGVAVLGWWCLPSALAGATSNCYGEETLLALYLSVNVDRGWGRSVPYMPDPLWSQCALWS